MKLLITTISFLFVFHNLSFSQEHEKDYRDLIHQELGGQKEVTVPGGRVDILTDEYAIEVDFAKKWKESIGQSLWYSLQTTKKPGIVIILRDKTEYNYFMQLNSALSHGGLQDKIKVWLWPDDFNSESIREPVPDPPLNQNKYWLTVSSNKRHNSECRYFENSKGNFCHEYEGIPCGFCGG